MKTHKIKRHKTGTLFKMKRHEIETLFWKTGPFILKFERDTQHTLRVMGNGFTLFS